MLSKRVTEREVECIDPFFPELFDNYKVRLMFLYILYKSKGFMKIYWKYLALFCIRSVFIYLLQECHNCKFDIF